MPRPRNFWDVLAGVGDAAGQNFASALLSRESRRERDDEDAFRRDQFEYRKLRDQASDRQAEVDRMNKILGFDAGPPKEPTPPSTFEAAAVRALMGGGSFTDPAVQSLLEADKAFNPPTSSKVNDKLPPDIGGEFASEANTLLNNWNTQRAITERAPSREYTDPKTGQMLMVRPTFNMPKPDLSALWWGKYAPKAGTLGLSADSIRQNLSMMYPQLTADRRPDVNAQPVNPFDPGNNILLQGLSNAMKVGGAPAGSATRSTGPPPPNDGSLTDAEYADFVQRWNRGKIR